MPALRVVGPTRLQGEVAISGAKNAALPILAASLLAGRPVTLHNVPDVGDVRTLLRLLGQLGVHARRLDTSGLRLETEDTSAVRADYECVRLMRAGFCVLGPLLARRGHAVVALPGGCRIGRRPVDLHLHGLAALGADLRLEHGYVVANAPRLRGACVHLAGPRGPTVTGAANVMSAATLARGATIITGAAMEPEIVDLGNFLISLGADIQGLGTPTIEIHGVETLAGAEHHVIPDRIEAATFLLAGAAVGGDVTLRNCQPRRLAAVTELLRRAGADLEISAGSIQIRSNGDCRPFDVDAAPYPGPPTDVQPLLAALLCTAAGRSLVRDRVFPERFAYADELNRLGAKIQCLPGAALIDGVPRLSGAEVVAPDLRAGAALAIAALCASGETRIRGMEHVERGYERFVEKFRGLGAAVECVDNGR